MAKGMLVVGVVLLTQALVQGGLVGSRGPPGPKCGPLCEKYCKYGFVYKNDCYICECEVPCNGARPLKGRDGRDLFCGLGPHSVRCPQNSYCHVHPTDRFAKCCPNVI